MTRRYWPMIYIILSVVLTIAIGLLGILPLWLRWLATMGVFIGLLVLIGREVTGQTVDAARRSRATTRFVPGRADGVLIDLRNKISLSRLQLVLWTVVVISAWVTLALHRTIPMVAGSFVGPGGDAVATVAGLLSEQGVARQDATAQATAVVTQLMGVDAAANLDSAAYSPLDIALPQEVLLALGISVASLAGAGAIKSNRATDRNGRATQIVENRVDSALEAASQAGQQVTALESNLERLTWQVGPEAMDGPRTDAQVAAEQARLAELEARVRVAEAAAARAEARAAEQAAELVAIRSESVGDLHAHASPADARWSDMLRGDTVANYAFADLGKIQMFLFTVVLVFSYAALVWAIMSMPAAEGVLQVVPSVALPAFADSAIITLALSHGGYLATKTTA